MDLFLAEKIEDVFDGDHLLLTSNEKAKFSKPTFYQKILDNKYYSMLIGFIIVLIISLIIFLVANFSNVEKSKTSFT